MLSIEKAQKIGKFGYWELNHQTGKLLWSEQLYSLFQKDKDDFTPTRESSIALIFEEDRDKVIEMFESCLRNKMSCSIEFRLMLPDGTMRYFSENCETTFSDDGEPLVTTAITRDNTDKAKTMLELAESKEKFMSISNQTTEGITVADMEGKYVFVNPAFCEMSGYSQAELLELTVFDMKAKDQDHSSFKESKEKSEGKPLSVKLKRKDGTEYLTEIIGDVIHVNGVEYVLGTIRDITDRVRQEKAIKDLNENLEMIVEERTKQLNESLAAKEMLLKEITHRVKNNMQIISSLINLQKSMMDSESCDFLDQVAHRVRSMALIHETLYKTNEFKFVQFNDYADALINYLADSFQTPNVHVSKNIENVQLELDTATCLGMIILELVTNSIKHAFPNNEEGEIRVEFSSNNGVHELSISDTGVGLPSVIDYKDTNSLGMQLVMSLTEQINGTISLENEQGTKFVLKVHE